MWLGLGLDFFVGILSIALLEVPRLYSLLGLVACGCPGHGPEHLLVDSVGVVGFA